MARLLDGRIQNSPKKRLFRNGREQNGEDGKQNLFRNGQGGFCTSSTAAWVTGVKRSNSITACEIICKAHAPGRTTIPAASPAAMALIRESGRSPKASRHDIFDCRRNTEIQTRAAPWKKATMTSVCQNSRWSSVRLSFLISKSPATRIPAQRVMMTPKNRRATSSMLHGFAEIILSMPSFGRRDQQARIQVGIERGNENKIGAHYIVFIQQELHAAGGKSLCSRLGSAKARRALMRLAASRASGEALARFYRDDVAVIHAARTYSTNVISARFNRVSRRH